MSISNHPGKLFSFSLIALIWSGILPSAYAQKEGNESEWSIDAIYPLSELWMTIGSRTLNLNWKWVDQPIEVQRPTTSMQ